jgi:hypothetical protein
MFPYAERVDLPGPQSLVDKEGFFPWMNRMVDKAYDVLLDNPDFWMARHPVFVTTFKRTLRQEAAGMRAKNGVISARDYRMLESRARSYALSQVRNTFYDTTRNTLAAEKLGRLMPFYRPWEDAMMSWGKLIYDDPRRLSRLGGAWNALDNVNVWLSDPILVDGEGQAIVKGAEPDSGVYIAVPFSKQVSKAFLDEPIQMYWRKEGLNSIAQGNVWWAPGLGPQAIVPATVAIGRLSPEQAVQLAGTDHWLGKFLLKNMYLEGQIPPTDLKSIAVSTFPAGWRNMFNDNMGVSGAMARQWMINKEYIDAQRAGRPFDPAKAQKRADRAAWAAGVVRFVSQTGMGMSGRAVTEGQFYVDQMHIYDAIPQAELQKMGYPNSKAMFLDKHPEAADLDFRFATNETGITASVNAQTSAAKYEKLIDQNPSLGWFIVGGENVAQGRSGDEFSRSVYNEQLSDGYGLQDAKRTRPSPGEAVKDALTAIGWKEWHKFTLGLDEYARRNNMPNEFKTFAKRQFRDQLGVKYPVWLESYTTRRDRATEFNVQAEAIAQRPEMRNRPDMQAYLRYRSLRQDVMNEFDIKSLTGTSEAYALARWKLRLLGEELAAENIGFSQTWDRMLEAEVEPLDTDELVLGRMQQSGANG